MSEQYRTLLSFMRDDARRALGFCGLEERGNKNTTRLAVVVATRPLHVLTRNRGGGSMSDMAKFRH
jgi:hypothetical protein